MGSAAIVALLSLTGGCVHVSYAPTGNVAPAALPADAEVQVFVSKRPDCPYDEIGVVRGTGALDEVYPALRAKARTVGANALFVTGGGMVTHTQGGKNMGGIQTTTSDVVEAVAVELRCPAAP
jgi:hypothetical protein